MPKRVRIGDHRGGSPPDHDNRWLVKDEFVRLVQGEFDEPASPSPMA